MDTATLRLLLLVTWQLLAPVGSFVLGQPPGCNTQCAYMYNPVCGSNGRTYPNLCFLFVASCRDPSLTLFQGGPCVIPDPCDIACTRKYEPVCGSDGVTYNNPCLLMFASCYYIGRGITRNHSGRCSSGSGGPTFILTPPSTTTRAPNRPSCPIGCTREYLPVCGSDGVTYSNQCNFNSVACKSQDLVKVNDGPCASGSGGPTFNLTPPPSTTTRAPTRPPCPFGCTRDYLPVCGSDGVTYSNQCNFNSVACMSQDLVKVNDGPCEQQIFPPTRPRCPLACNKVYDPVCGSDGVTYTNQCIFTKESCKNPSLSKVKDGPCDPSSVNTTPRPAATTESNRDFCLKDCPFNYDPICGTDGVTYTNKCTFDVAVCKEPSLKVEYNGSCNNIFG